MHPAPVIVQPDAEAWVFANLQHVHGLTCFSYAATQDWPGWTYRHFIQVDARAKAKGAARDLAERARQIISGLADVPWPDGVVSYVQPVEGPFWLADDDGAPRYTARYEIRVHPRRPAPQAAPVPAASAGRHRRKATP